LEHGAAAACSLLACITYPASKKYLGKCRATKKKHRTNFLVRDIVNMKIVNFLLPLLIASVVKGREIVLDDDDRDVDSGMSPGELPCKVSSDGTFRSTSSDYVEEATFTFQMEYDTSFKLSGLQKEMNEIIGNLIIANIFASCQSRRRLFDLHSDLESIITGMDTNAKYANVGSCNVSSEGSACEIMTGGYNVYLLSRRKLASGGDIVDDAIVSIVKDAMDSGEVASMVDGIIGLKFGRTDEEPNEEDEGEDEKEADEVQEHILEEDLELEEDSEGDVVGQGLSAEPDDGDAPPRPRTSYAWVAICVPTTVIALVGYRYYKKNKDASLADDESEFEVENILMDATDKRGTDDDFIEVVSDSGR
jgi:hypothetical protein